MGTRGWLDVAVTLTERIAVVARALLTAYVRPSKHRIGFWYSEQEPWLPRPRTTVWPPEHQRKVVEYLKRGQVKDRYFGTSHCRLCDRSDNGSADYSDGTYTWPEGLAHYVEAHSVELPGDFVQHALSNHLRA